MNDGDDLGLAALDGAQRVLRTGEHDFVQEFVVVGERYGAAGQLAGGRGNLHGDLLEREGGVGACEREDDARLGGVDAGAADDGGEFGGERQRNFDLMASAGLEMREHFRGEHGIDDQ